MTAQRGPAVATHGFFNLWGRPTLNVFYHGIKSGTFGPGSWEAIKKKIKTFFFAL